MAERLLAERPSLRLRSGAIADALATVTGTRPGRDVEVRVEGVTLPAGTHLDASFTRWDDATYRFTTTVLALPGPASTHVLAWPAEVVREQHRNHVRAAVHTSVRLAPAGPRLAAARGVALPAGNYPPAVGWQEADLLDLSAGGAAVAAPAGLCPDQVVLVRAEVAGRDRTLVLDVRARVVRATGTISRDGGRGQISAYGLQFLDLPPGDQDALMAAILWRKTIDRSR